MMYKENGLNYVETQMELDLLEGMPYYSGPTVTDPNDPDYEGEYPIAVASELKPGKKVYVMHEGVSRGGIFVNTFIIKEVIAVTKADNEYDMVYSKMLREKYLETNSFLVGDTRYYLGLEEVE